MAVQGQPPRAHDTPDPDEQRLNMIDPAQQAAGDGGSRAEDDDEEDRALAQLEKKDGEREPGDRGHRLEAEDRGADRLAQDPDPGHRDAQSAAEGRGYEVAGQRAAQRDPDADEKVGLAQVLQ